MKTLQCQNCGAKLSQYTYKCEYCQSALFVDSPLSAETKTKVVQAIKGWENTLAAAKNDNESKVFGGCLVIFLAWGAISYGIYRFNNSQVPYFIVGLLAMVFFVLFGAIVNIYEHKSIRQKFNKSLRREMDDYLLSINCHKTDFKNIAFEVLEKNSWLYKVLSDF